MYFLVFSFPVSENTFENLEVRPKRLKTRKRLEARPHMFLGIRAQTFRNTSRFLFSVWLCFVPFPCLGSPIPMRSEPIKAAGIPSPAIHGSMCLCCCQSAHSVLAPRLPPTSIHCTHNSLLWSSSLASRCVLMFCRWIRCCVAPAPPHTPRVHTADVLLFFCFSCGGVVAG